MFFGSACMNWAAKPEGYGVSPIADVVVRQQDHG
jgi:hypothetical protein